MVDRDVLRAERLVGEAHVHDRGRMPLGGAEVDQPALGDEVEPLAAEVELLDVLADLADVALGHGPQRGEVQLGIEVARVGHDRAVVHGLEVLAPEDVDVAGRGDEQVAPGGAASPTVMTAKPSISASSARTGSTSTTVTCAPWPAIRDVIPLPDPAVARDDDLAAGDEDVRRPQDAVERALAGAVAVVEEVLGLGLVDRDDREAERPVGGHRPQPDDAGRRLLGAGEDLRHLVRTLLWRSETRSQPSSIVSCGWVSATASRWA